MSTQPPTLGWDSKVAIKSPAADFLSDADRRSLGTLSVRVAPLVDQRAAERATDAMTMQARPKQPKDATHGLVKVSITGNHDVLSHILAKAVPEQKVFATAYLLGNLGLDGTGHAARRSGTSSPAPTTAPLPPYQESRSLSSRQWS